ncbi:hypothetical protein MKW94_014032 [Papaver nudicaule]|uniref:Uncharacterized protein n=1 Tax=Papaver nudicaule TaxID=74823 RepID=A0AA41SEN6_PAPNU|nr:hypothetical protein [Papaver nudicaule]
MDNEMMRGKVISRELALQNEVRFLKKIENLQKPPGQGVPSKVALEESQQKIYLQNETCSQDPVYNKQHELGSPVKQTTLREVAHLQFQGPPTPFQGMKRKAHIEDFTCSSPKLEQECYLCKECQVPCSGAANFKQHCDGKKHKKKVEELRYLKSCKDKKELGPVLCDKKELVPVWWCNICSVTCTDKSAYQQHLDGKKHASCLSAVNNAREAKQLE